MKARAQYDNIAEAPDELAFRKGDVLTVLEQNTAGLEGWWLCALRGRQVITSFTGTLHATFQQEVDYFTWPQGTLLKNICTWKHAS